MGRGAAEPLPLVVRISRHAQSPHEYRTRIGLREARFDVEGFFLNGKRLYLFGLDRHELYPYVGVFRSRCACCAAMLRCCATA